MDVARDAAPLVFLRGHQSREQRLDFVLCSAPYADFDLKRPIRSREFRRSFADSLLQGVIQPAQPLLGLAQRLFRPGAFDGCPCTLCGFTHEFDFMRRPCARRAPTDAQRRDEPAVFDQRHGDE